MADIKVDPPGNYIEPPVETRAPVTTSSSILLAIADALPALISYVDADYRYQFNNRAYEEWFGHSREEIRGKPLIDVLGQAAFEAIRPYAERALAGESVAYETEVPYRDGGQRWVQATYTPDIAPDGRVRGFFALVNDISLSRAHDEVLRSSQERSRLAEVAARFGTWEWDLAERVTWSESMEQIYGFAPGAYPGTFEAFLEHVHPDDRQATTDAVARVLEDPGSELDFEHRIMLHDGSERWLNGRGRVIRDADGKPLKMIGIGLDVTERKHAEQALSRAATDARDALQLVDTIIDSTPTAFAMFDRELRYIRVNHAAAEINGLSVEEHLGRRVEEVLPDVGPAAAERYRHVLASGEPMSVEEIAGETPAAPGEQRWWLHSASPVHNGEGDIVAVAVIFTEITERKRAEAALRASEQREHLRAEVNARLVSSLDPAQILTEVAELAVPALADICAIGLFDDSPATPRVHVAGVRPGDASAIERVHLRRWLVQPGSSLTIGEAMMAGEHAYMPNFHRKWIAACAPDAEQVAAARDVAATSVACVPLVARGRAIGMVTFATTHSKRRLSPQDLLLARHIAAQTSIAVDNAQLLSNLVETASSLRRANQAKDEFLSLVSHELKTPITMILGNAEVLERRQDDLHREDRTVALADIKHESERLYRIIDNLLALARIDTGQTVEPEPLVLGRLVQRVVDRQRRVSTDRVFLCRWQGEDDLVTASPDYIEQVLRNLISNAEKYSRAPDAIEVFGSNTDNEVQVRVLDRGPGISEEDVERIFTPFYRSPRTSATAQGVGIGLAVCKRLIEAQGGRLWACAREGGGSEFGFALPRLPAEP